MTRNEVIEMLPLLANGSLQGPERDQVAAAVAADPSLEAELEALQTLRSTMQAEVAYSPGALGLARLMRNVEAEQAPVLQTPRRPWLWQAAAAVLLAVALGQTAFLMQRDVSGGYELAGAPVSALAGASTPAFTIAIRPDATEAELRSLLLYAGVEIVAGPSALGLYQLALVEGMAQAEAGDILAGSTLIESVSTVGE